MTGTSWARAFPMRALMLAMTSSRLGAPATAPFCTSMTSSAVLVRSGKVVMVSILGEGGEEFPEVGDDQVRVGGVGEVAAGVELGVADDVGGALREGADGPVVVGEDRDRGRDLAGCLPVAC